MTNFDFEKFKQQEREYKFKEIKKAADEIKKGEEPEDPDFLENSRNDNDPVTEDEKRKKARNLKIMNEARIKVLKEP